MTWLQISVAWAQKNGQTAPAMLISSLVTIGRKWTQPICPTSNECGTYTLWNYSDTEKSKITTFPCKWIERRIDHDE